MDPSKVDFHVRLTAAARNKSQRLVSYKIPSRGSAILKTSSTARSSVRVFGRSFPLGTFAGDAMLVRTFNDCKSSNDVITIKESAVGSNLISVCIESKFN